MLSLIAVFTMYKGLTHHPYHVELNAGIPFPDHP
jgi:hypothetical protein